MYPVIPFYGCIYVGVIRGKPSGPSCPISILGFHFALFAKWGPPVPKDLPPRESTAPIERDVIGRTRFDSIKRRANFVGINLKFLRKTYSKLVTSTDVYYSISRGTEYSCDLITGHCTKRRLFL